MADVEFLLDMRERARRAGDRGIYLATTADLARIGYIDPPQGAARVTTAAGMETTAIVAPERAVPQVNPKPAPGRQKRPGGRPPLPRCPHNKIVGRCTKCAPA